MRPRSHPRAAGYDTFLSSIGKDRASGYLRLERHEPAFPRPMATQTFTRNHTDHSNDTGFQFEFFCDKCGSGHRSEYRTNSLGFAAQMVKAAGSLLGGGVARAGWGADHLKDAFRGPA